jgi:hypothetical protein
MGAGEMVESVFQLSDMTILPRPIKRYSLLPIEIAFILANS